jgi:hypothetical protein
MACSFFDRSRWNLDEVFVSIGGRRMYPWLAVDDEDEVLDVLVQAKRDKRAALKLMRKLPSYGTALRPLGATRHHLTGCRLNNRAEKSHLTELFYDSPPPRRQDELKAAQKLPERHSMVLDYAERPRQASCPAVQLMVRARSRCA